MLDYLSDFICCLYGKPGAYGVVTLPFSVREGINIFLAGFVPTENLRFREEGLTFKVAENAGEGDDDVKKFARYTYPVMSKTQVRSCQLPCYQQTTPVASKPSLRISPLSLATPPLSSAEHRCQLPCDQKRYPDICEFTVSAASPH